MVHIKLCKHIAHIKQIYSCNIILLASIYINMEFNKIDHFFNILLVILFIDFQSLFY